MGTNTLTWQGLENRLNRIGELEEEFLTVLQKHNARLQKALNDEEKWEKNIVNVIGVTGIVGMIVAYLLFRNDIDAPGTKYAASVLGFGLTSLSGILKLNK